MLTICDPAPVTRDAPEWPLRAFFEKYWAHHNHECNKQPDANKNAIEYSVRDATAEEEKRKSMYCNYL